MTFLLGYPIGIFIILVLETALGKPPWWVSEDSSGYAPEWTP